MDKLQQLISNTADCSQIRTWEFFFQTTSETAQAGETYRLFLEALASSGMSADLLVLEEDVVGMSKFPLNKIQVLTLAGISSDGQIENLGPEWRAILNYAVGEAVAGELNLVFRGELGSSGDPSEAAETSTVIGRIRVDAGAIVLIYRTCLDELSGFEKACIKMFPDAFVGNSEEIIERATRFILSQSSGPYKTAKKMALLLQSHFKLSDFWKNESA